MINRNSKNLKQNNLVNKTNQNTVQKNTFKKMIWWSVAAGATALLGIGITTAVLLPKENSISLTKTEIDLEWVDQTEAIVDVEKILKNKEYENIEAMEAELYNNKALVLKLIDKNELFDLWDVKITPLSFNENNLRTYDVKFEFLIKEGVTEAYEINGKSKTLKISPEVNFTAISNLANPSIKETISNIIPTISLEQYNSANISKAINEVLKLDINQTALFQEFENGDLIEQIQLVELVNSEASKWNLKFEIISKPGYNFVESNRFLTIENVFIKKGVELKLNQTGFDYLVNSLFTTVWFDKPSLQAYFADITNNQVVHHNIVSNIKVMDYKGNIISSNVGAIINDYDLSIVEKEVKVPGSIFKHFEYSLRITSSNIDENYALNKEAYEVKLGIGHWRWHNDSQLQFYEWDEIYNYS